MAHFSEPAIHGVEKIILRRIKKVHEVGSERKPYYTTEIIFEGTRSITGVASESLLLNIFSPDGKGIQIVIDPGGENE